MSELVAPGIEEYCETHTTPLHPLFSELRKTTYEKTEWPQMQVGPLEGSFLKALVAISGARRVLEIGTFTGYSALAMAEGLPEDGKLITCDIDPETTAIAREFWARSPHGKKIELRLAPAIETIAKLEGLFDLVFIDADKESYIQYWDACVPKVRKGGVIVADNVLWGGAVLHPEDESDHHIVAFNQHARKDPRVEEVMLTVRDGMLLARKL